MELKDNIIRFRKERGLTQEQLANILNVTIGAVSKWETGSNWPALELLPSLAEVFQVSIDVLLGYEKPYNNLDHVLEGIELLLVNENYKVAIEKTEHILKRYPNDFKVNKVMADIYYSICFSKAELADKKEYAERSIYYYERCLELYDEKFAHFSTREMLHIHIATLYMLEELKQYGDAIKIFEKYNGSGMYTNLIASCLFASGRQNEALTNVLYHCVGNQVFVFNDFSVLADMFEKMGNYEAAIKFIEAEVETFKLFMDENGNYANRAYAGQAYIIAGLHKKNGNLSEAMIWMERAKEHAKIYAKNPSMKISSLKYCEAVKGRMIDSFGEIIEELLQDVKPPN